MEKAAMLIVLLLLPLLAFAQTQHQCVPDCVKGATPPNNGGSSCLCTFDATLPGCIVTACKPGEDAEHTYVCECTPESHQDGCVSLRCTNGTEAYSSVATAASQLIGQGVKPSCNNLCNCDVQPPDCTKHSRSPLEPGAPACSCNTDNWLNGCTFKPCQEGDTLGHGYYFCECTDKHHPDFCLRPQCKSVLM